METIILEYEDRDFLGRAFIMRRIGSPLGSPIQQAAWGVALDPVCTPSIFPIYYQATGFSKKGNERTRDVAFGIGRVVDYALTHEEAISKAYTLAREAAGSDYVDRTRFSTLPQSPSDDPYHQLWYHVAWYPEI